MGLAFGKIDKFREVAVTSQADVQFDSPFGLAELGPGKNGKAEIDNRGI